MERGELGAWVMESESGEEEDRAGWEAEDGHGVVLGGCLCSRYCVEARKDAQGL